MLAYKIVSHFGNIEAVEANKRSGRSNGIGENSQYYSGDSQPSEGDLESDGDLENPSVDETSSLIDAFDRLDHLGLLLVQCIAKNFQRSVVSRGTSKELVDGTDFDIQINIPPRGKSPATFVYYETSSLMPTAVLRLRNCVIFHAQIEGDIYNINKIDNNHSMGDSSIIKPAMATKRDIKGNLNTSTIITRCFFWDEVLILLKSDLVDIFRQALFKIQNVEVT